MILLEGGAEKGELGDGEDIQETLSYMNLRKFYYQGQP